MTSSVYVLEVTVRLIVPSTNTRCGADAEDYVRNAAERFVDDVIGYEAEMREPMVVRGEVVNVTALELRDDGASHQ